MRNIRLVIEYDGSALCGWQRQANGPTVQGHLEDALTAVLAHTVKVTGASRTDAGVHARGQVASFCTDRTIPARGICRAVNTLLPPAIAIREATEVGEEFHARFSASGKHYRYTILTSRERSPRWHDRAWHLYKKPLDLAAMRAGAAVLVGEHDFAAFRAIGCSATTTRRKLERIEVSTPESELVVVDVHGNAFLRNMVRILVGTLAEVGMGARPASQLSEIIASLDRTQAGITAPAGGLELMEVRYDGRRPRPQKPGHDV